MQAAKLIQHAWTSKKDTRGASASMSRMTALLNKMKAEKDFTNILKGYLLLHLKSLILLPTQKSCNSLS